MRLIGLGHAAGVGKDTVGAYLTEQHDFARIAFADSIRSMVSATDADVRRLVDQHGWEDAKRSHPSVRSALVTMGDTARTILGPDVWLRPALDAVCGPTVFTDTRHPNEVDAIRQAGGILVKVTRPGFVPLPNATDQALAHWDGWDYELANGGSIAELHQATEAILRHRWPELHAS